MQSSALISARQLTRNYSQHVAVDNIGFELRQGEVLGLLGPNGAGKSTTLLMLSGNLCPSSGEIVINGHDLVQEPIAAKSHIGFLSENPPLYPELTVDEYLLFAGRLRGLSKPYCKKKREEVKQKCGLAKVGRKLIHQLSHGYRQRVGIAQAIIHDPEFILLDEPTKGLDPLQIQDIRSLIRSLGKEHGIILSSHILPEVQSICDRVLIINQGKIIYNEMLHQAVKHNQVIVGLRQAPALAELQAIDGVIQCEKLSDQLFLIEHQGQQSFGVDLAQLAQEKNWQLFELATKDKTLEEVFVDIMQYNAEKPSV